MQKKLKKNTEEETQTRRKRNSVKHKREEHKTHTHKKKNEAKINDKRRT